MHNEMLLKKLSLDQASIDNFKNINWADKDVYAQYLAQTYFYVNHSERFLALCIGLFNNEDRKLQRRFIAHLGEESAHDQLLINDLKNLGHDIRNFEELPATKSFWETQYYKIEHCDPAILLGYIYFLEAFAAQVVPETTKKLEALYGRKCTTFLRLHAEEDQDHVEKAFTFIASLSLDRQKEICINHAQSMQAFNQMIKSVVHAAAKNNQKAG